MDKRQPAYAIYTPSLQAIRRTAVDGPRSPEVLAAFQPQVLGPAKPVLAYPKLRVNGPSGPRQK